MGNEESAVNVIYRKMIDFIKNENHEFSQADLAIVMSDILGQISARQEKPSLAIDMIEQHMRMSFHQTRIEMEGGEI